MRLLSYTARLLLFSRAMDPRPADIAYAAFTEAATFMLDADGICRWTVTRPGARGGAEATLAERCVGAQYVATLDVRQQGGLVELPKPGCPLLFARLDERGRISLLRTGPLLRFEKRGSSRELERTMSREPEALAVAAANAMAFARTSLASEEPSPLPFAKTSLASDPPAPLPFAKTVALAPDEAPAIPAPVKVKGDSGVHERPTPRAIPVPQPIPELDAYADESATLRFSPAQILRAMHTTPASEPEPNTQRRGVLPRRRPKGPAPLPPPPRVHSERAETQPAAAPAPSGVALRSDESDPLVVQSASRGRRG